MLKALNTFEVIDFNLSLVGTNLVLALNLASQDILEVKKFRATFKTTSMQLILKKGPILLQLLGMEPLKLHKSLILFGLQLRHLLVPGFSEL